MRKGTEVKCTITKIKENLNKQKKKKKVCSDYIS